MKRVIVFAGILVAVAAVTVIALQQDRGEFHIPDSARRVAIDVEGMTCAGCAVSVKLVLDGLDGVYQSDIDTEAGKAVITYEEETVMDRYRVGVGYLSHPLPDIGLA